MFCMSHFLSREIQIEGRFPDWEDKVAAKLSPHDQLLQPVGLQSGSLLVRLDFPLQTMENSIVQEQALPASSTRTHTDTHTFSPQCDTIITTK